VFFTKWYYNVVSRELSFIGEGDQRIAVTLYEENPTWTTQDFNVPTPCDKQNVN